MTSRRKIRFPFDTSLIFDVHNTHTHISQRASAEQQQQQLRPKERVGNYRLKCPSLSRITLPRLRGHPFELALLRCCCCSSPPCRRRRSAARTEPPRRRQRNSKENDKKKIDAKNAYFRYYTHIHTRCARQPVPRESNGVSHEAIYSIHQRNTHTHTDTSSHFSLRRSARTVRVILFSLSLSGNTSPRERER